MCFLTVLQAFSLRAVAGHISQKLEIRIVPRQISHKNWRLELCRGKCLTKIRDQNCVTANVSQKLESKH